MCPTRLISLTAYSSIVDLAWADMPIFRMGRFFRHPVSRMATEKAANGRHNGALRRRGSDVQVALWVIWVVIAVIALAGEMFTLGLYLGSFGVAAAIVALLSLTAPLVAQIAVFLALSLTLLFVARPLVLRVLPRLDEATTLPTMGPIGKDAVVVQRLTRQSGQIRVGEGEFWSARAIEPDVLLPAGREVEVVKMDGLTALVRPVAVAGRELEGREVDPFGLSLREVEVLQLVAHGLTNQ